MTKETPDIAAEAIGGDTPEDVAVLYSWANLQGAKYRDFSASRREYRAQLRLRAAEEQRQAEAQALAEAEAAAAEAEQAAREAEEAARFHETAARRAAEARQRKELEVEEDAAARAKRQAEELARMAAAERIEAARRAEAVAAAEAARDREIREMEDARASAERQAARYHESEQRRRERAGPQPVVVPGEISDPYSTVQQTLPAHMFHQPEVAADAMLPSRHPHTRDVRLIVPQVDPAHPHAPMEREFLAVGTTAQDALLAARGLDAIAKAAEKADSPVRHYQTEPNSAETAAAVDVMARQHRSGARSHSRGEVSQVRPAARAAATPEASVFNRPAAKPIPSASAGEEPVRRSGSILGLDLSLPVTPVAKPIEEKEQHPPREEKSSLRVPVAAASLLETPAAEAAAPVKTGAPAPVTEEQEMLKVRRQIAERRESAAREQAVSRKRREPPGAAVLGLPHESSAASAAAASGEPEEEQTRVVPVPGRSGQEISSGQRAYAAAKAEAAARSAQTPRRIRGYSPEVASGFFPAYGSARAQAIAAEPVEPVVPAWLNEPAEALEATPAKEPSRITSDPRRRMASSGNMPAAESLQHSRERVAARWYALKGVFDHGVEELRAEQEARKERERRVPVVGIFSLAGGVGKTSLVATLGRTLSSTGEKVLLADTTSHGLLPFYFGASELKAGVVRTFSPPSGSSDAPIYLVSYDVLQRSGDKASQEWLTTELGAKSEGMSRVIADLSACSPWVARKLAANDATMLVPLAPDMNSVISLGAMEKFFAGIKDAEGKRVEPFYLLNKFDSSLALHLDVREVLRQQLGERLLPFVIHRVAALPEALAEGMTVIDYAGDSAVAEDFRSLATWLKSRSAPAQAAVSPSRWSER